MKDVLLEVATIQPLIEHEDQLVFDREAFFRKALEIAEVPDEA